ncbi:MAG TPA: hypothetical protein ENJ82_17950 [Bacteroidetes bacterium]|nr:hypothetical protein [Bacteroidota bacterium]
MNRSYKTFTFIALLFISIGFSSCFDIFEEYHFNKDGSGSAKFTVDVSQMMTLMESFSASMDSTGEMTNSVDEMFSDNKAEKSLQQLPGISDIKTLNDKAAGIVGFSYKFANLEALNNALIATDGNLDMSKMMEMGEEGATGESSTENTFSKKGNKWTRVFELNRPKNEEEEDEFQGMAEAMFADHYYTIQYYFEQNVKKVKKNDNAQIGADGKSVEIKTSMQDLIKGQANFSSLIKVK